MKMSWKTEDDSSLPLGEGKHVFCLSEDTWQCLEMFFLERGKCLDITSGGPWWLPHTETVIWSKRQASVPFKNFSDNSDNGQPCLGTIGILKKVVIRYAVAERPFKIH